MLLNVDRRRIYIFSGVGLFLIVMLALYHAPAYVPAEVSRMRTSVSTWLKGTEPSLNDELYKDSEHFSSSTKQHQQSTNKDKSTPELFEEEDPYEIKDATGEEAFHILPIETDDRPNILPPSDTTSDENPPHSFHSDPALPGLSDFVGILPPVDAFSAGEADATHATGHPKPTGTHPHMEEITSHPPDQSTTLATHVSSASGTAVWQPSDSIPTNAHDAFELDKWYSPEDDDRKRT